MAVVAGDNSHAIKIALITNDPGYNTHVFTDFGAEMVFRYSGRLTEIENESILSQFEGECIVRLGSTVWLNGASEFQITPNGIRASTAYGSTPRGNLKGSVGGSVAAVAMDWSDVEEASIYGNGRKRNLVSLSGDGGISELEVRVRAWTIDGVRQKRIKDARFLIDYLADRIAAARGLESNQVTWSDDGDVALVSFTDE